MFNRRNCLPSIQHAQLYIAILSSKCIILTTTPKFSPTQAVQVVAHSFCTPTAELYMISSIPTIFAMENSYSCIPSRLWVAVSYFNIDSQEFLGTTFFLDQVFFFFFVLTLSSNTVSLLIFYFFSNFVLPVFYN